MDHPPSAETSEHPVAVEGDLNKPEVPAPTGTAETSEAVAAPAAKSFKCEE